MPKNAQAVFLCKIVIYQSASVGRGHDPADPVANFNIVKLVLNGTICVSLASGGVMTPPYSGVWNTSTNAHFVA